MNPRFESPANAISRWIMRAAIAAVLGYVLWRTRGIIVTILIAAVVAAALEPMVAYICRRRIRFIHPRTQRLLAAILVFVAAFGLLAGSATLIARPFGHEFQRIGNYAVFAKQTVKHISDEAASVYAGLPKFARDIISSQNSSTFGKRLDQVTELLTTHASVWLSHLWEAFVIPVLAFYFVVDSLSLKKYFVSFFPRDRRREVMTVMRDASRVFRSYIVGQVILCLLAGVFMGLLLSYWKVKYSITLAVLAGITRAVPIVGPILSGAVIFLIIVASNTKLALTVLVVFSVMHFVESKVIMPVLIGDLMRLHPAVLLVSILVGYEFFGVLGMFMAAPVAALSRLLITQYYLQRRDSTHAGPGTGTPARLDMTESGSESAISPASSTAVA